MPPSKHSHSSCLPTGQRHEESWQFTAPQHLKVDYKCLSWSGITLFFSRTWTNESHNTWCRYWKCSYPDLVCTHAAATHFKMFYFMVFSLSVQCDWQTSQIRGKVERWKFWILQILHAPRTSLTENWKKNYRTRWKHEIWVVQAAGERMQFSMWKILFEIVQNY